MLSFFGRDNKLHKWLDSNQPITPADSTLEASLSFDDYDKVGAHLDQQAKQVILTKELIAKKQPTGINLDIACGAHKQNGDWVGIDYLPYRGVVDIVHNIEITPWPLPSECVANSIAPHILEHITPHFGDSRLEPLARLLVDNGTITQQQKEAYMGDPGPAFLRVMDEIWRITKPGGTFAMVSPYSGSPGDFWDPTHINHLNETTFTYFDPESLTHNFTMWKFYQPKPWHITDSYIAGGHLEGGNIEVRLVKRPDIYRMVTLDEYVVCPNSKPGREHKTNEMFVIDDERNRRDYSCYLCGAVWPVPEGDPNGKK